MEDLTKFIRVSADNIEGEIGGCAIDDLREDRRYFQTTPSAYDIEWFVSRARSTVDPSYPRYSLAIHKGQQYILDLDDYNERADSDDADMDQQWQLVH